MIGHVCFDIERTKFYPLRWETTFRWFPYGVQIWSLSVLYLPLRFFLFQNHPLGSTFLNPKNILSPVAGLSFRWSPMGSQFDLFLFYIPHIETFVDLNFLKQIGVFLVFRIFIVTEGWWTVDGKKKFSDFTPNFSDEVQAK